MHLNINKSHAVKTDINLVILVNKQSSKKIISNFGFFFSYPRKFSIFCPRSFQTGREKNLENRQKKKIVPEKKTAKFNPRKKKSLPEKKIQNFPSWNSKKYLEFLKFQKKKKKPRKNLKICPRKLQNARENHVKVGEKNIFHPRKKPKKSAKKLFLGHFSFSRVRKKTLNCPTSWRGCPEPRSCNCRWNIYG